jgi:hypothetical protein
MEPAPESRDAYVVWKGQVGLDLLEFRPVGGCCSVSLFDLLEFFVGCFFSVYFPEGVF